jgi:hypothetical protein
MDDEFLPLTYMGPDNTLEVIGRGRNVRTDERGVHFQFELNARGEALMALGEVPGLAKSALSVIMPDTPAEEPPC